MVEQGDQPIKLEIFVFDGETFEQKSRKMFERTWSRCLSVFLCQFFVIVLLLVYVE